LSSPETSQSRQPSPTSSHESYLYIEVFRESLFPAC
jgi:hypothetical protein